jgi:hypothetical protein
MIEEYKHRIE